jgi:hypothetical protein
MILTLLLCSYISYLCFLAVVLKSVKSSSLCYYNLSSSLIVASLVLGSETF